MAASLGRGDLVEMLVEDRRVLVNMQQKDGSTALCCTAPSATKISALHALLKSVEMNVNVCSAEVGPDPYIIFAR